MIHDEDKSNTGYYANKNANSGTIEFFEFIRIIPIQPSIKGTRTNYRIHNKQHHILTKYELIDCIYATDDPERNIDKFSNFLTHFQQPLSQKTDSWP